MKKLLYTLFIIPLIALGQVPQGVNYQAVAYDSDGFELSNKEVGVRISIVEGSAFGTPQLVEEHDVITTEQGLFSIIIGQGALLGGEVASLLDIPWGSNTYFLKIELDTENNGSYMDFGTQQFMSVPYALYAESSGTPGPQGEIGPQGEPADPVDYDSLANMLSVDSTFLASVFGGVEGCDFLFPEGIDGDFLVHDLSTSYSVPNGKNLYITHVYSDGGDLSINGVRQLYGYFNHSFAGNNYINSFNIIAGEGQVVTNSSFDKTCSFSGFLIDKTVVEPISHSLSGNPNGITSSVFTVPLNKKLIINNIFIYDNFGGLSIDNTLVQYGAKNMSWGGSDIDFSNTILVDGGSDVSGGTMETSINGYLVDEDYFDNCGGSSSSNESSYLDSTMVADMIAASGIGVDLAFGEYEILYPGINFEYIGNVKYWDTLHFQNDGILFGQIFGNSSPNSSTSIRIDSVNTFINPISIATSYEFAYPTDIIFAPIKKDSYVSISQNNNHIISLFFIPLESNLSPLNDSDSENMLANFTKIEANESDSITISAIPGRDILLTGQINGHLSCWFHLDIIFHDESYNINDNIKGAGWMMPILDGSSITNSNHFQPLYELPSTSGYWDKKFYYRFEVSHPMDITIYTNNTECGDINYLIQY